jgi:hypothetical protein
MTRTRSLFSAALLAGLALSFLPLSANAQVPSFQRPPLQRSTFAAGFAGLAVPATGAGDAVCLTGSATKTIFVTRVAFSGIKATVDNKVAVLVKRTVADTGGTSTSAAIAAMDSTNATATSALKGYTAVPTPGAGANLRSIAVTYPVATATSQVAWDFSPAINLSQPVILRGVAQSLCINFPAAFATDGPALDADFTWTEQ